MRHALDLFSWAGRVPRWQYLLAGLLLFGLKYPLDLLLSTSFGQPWNPLMYISLRVSPLLRPDADRAYLVALTALALPFMAVGLSLSARRLRDMGVSPFWAGLFLFPFLHFAFIAALVVCPPAGPRGALDLSEGWLERLPPRFLARAIPPSLAGSFVFGLITSLGLGLSCFVIARQVDESLGGGLFMGVPFGMGFLMGFSTTVGGRVGVLRAMASSLAPLSISMLALLGVGWEGVACLVMALPILITMCVGGAAVAWFVVRTLPLPLGTAGALAAPLLLGIDLAAPPPPEPMEVVSTITIAAPPEIVWESVVSFPPIDSPPDWIFVLVGMPIEARIEGRDPGATRRCVFTNGEFVEPILTWDAPRELTFGVREQPRELDRYLDVRKGQFLLTRNDDGTTTLRGTTWYRLKVRPAIYWGWWTDTLLHAVHLRVLEHVKRIAEHDTPSPSRAATMPAWMSTANATCRCTRHLEAGTE